MSRAFQQVKFVRNEGASKLATAFTQPAISRFATGKCGSAGVTEVDELPNGRDIERRKAFMMRLPDLSQEKDLPEDLVECRTRAAHAMCSDIDQELLEEQIV